MVNEAKQNKNVCQIPPKFRRLSWWTNSLQNRQFILLGFWYCDDCEIWRIELLEFGKEKSKIFAELEFNEMVKDRLLILVNEDKNLN